MITGNPPDRVGDLAAFSATFTPPADRPTLVASAMTVRVCRPDGTVVDDSAGVVAAGTNAFRYVATFKINAPGTWEWDIETSGSLIASDGFKVEIRSSRFPPLG